MAANKRPSSTGGLKSVASRSATPSRFATPTGRSTLPAKTKPSRASTPTSRAILPTTAKPRASTPTSRATQPFIKPMVRSSTPTRPMTRSSTPTARPSVLALAASKTTSRSTTPTLKNKVTKSGATNLKTSLLQRPVAAFKGRPVAPTPSARSSSRGRVSNGIAYVNGIRVVAMSRADSTCNDDVSPVVMGTKMVERVVNMRKLAPPNQDGCTSKKNNSSEKSLSSQEKSGFKRTLSRSSLDMALRHMVRTAFPCTSACLTFTLFLDHGFMK
ncbi:hypothetical protein RHMOL_Rhmol01G0104200 [Rhododendron molle]|uniref:Uncharacterized protein n=1 Tax=Rhododendron molle TaxID=49168 RepID=A0ACC0Q2Y0_RHOML|nr:hypothetical protein RHMOL_Rhmol01G0104200 [Rhododendron molle]